VSRTPRTPAPAARRRPAVGGIPFVVALALALGFGLGGCATSGGSPSPSSADFEGVVGELDRVHIGVDHVVSGDAGCDDPSLVPTAIAFDASGLDQPTPVRVHLYRFADAATYDRLRPAVDRCAARFVTDPNAYVAIDASPYVATSAGPWAPGFTGAFRSALIRASGG
jgi:hypothetical protein